MLLIIWGGLSWHYARIFTHPTAVYEHNYRYNPHNIYPLILLATKYAHRGEEEQARATLQRVVQNPEVRYFYPFMTVVEKLFGLEDERWLFISMWYQHLGNLQEARRQLQKGLSIHPARSC